MDSVGEGEGGKIWENGIETCVTSWMKWVASPGSMHDTGSLGLVHWDDPEGWYGEGGGSTPMADSCWCMAKPIQYCKVISLQLNKFILKKKKQHWIPSMLKEETETYPQSKINSLGWNIFLFCSLSTELIMHSLRLSYLIWNLHLSYS